MCESVSTFDVAADVFTFNSIDEDCCFRAGPPQKNREVCSRSHCSENNTIKEVFYQDPASDIPPKTLLRPLVTSEVGHSRSNHFHKSPTNFGMPVQSARIMKFTGTLCVTSTQRDKRNTIKAAVMPNRLCHLCQNQYGRAVCRAGPVRRHVSHTSLDVSMSCTGQYLFLMLSLLKFATKHEEPQSWPI